MTRHFRVSGPVPTCRIFSLLGFACLVLLALSERAQAQFSFGPAPERAYYSCGPQCGVIGATGIYLVCGDIDSGFYCDSGGNVTCDTLSGLVWYSTPSNAYNCFGVTVAGQYGAGCAHAPPSVAPNIGPPGPNNRQNTTTEPISTGSGNYFYQHVDFSLPGHLPLVFQRTYNALSTFSGPMGAHWTHSYYIRLGQNSTGAVIQWGDGHGENFTLNGSTYVPEPGITDTLTMDSSTGWFYLTDKNRAQYRFDHDGNLWTITDRNGSVVQMQYDGNNNLTLIQESSAALNLAYDSAGHLISVDDNNGRTVHFSYGTQTANAGTVNVTTNSTAVTGTGTAFTSGMVGGMLTVGTTLMGRVVSVQSATSLMTDAMWLGSNATGNSYSLTYGTDLSSVTDAAGGLTKYAYDSQHHLTSITLPDGAVLVRNTYDSSGRVISQTNARSFTTTLAYNSPAAGQTTITDPLGHKAIHTYDPQMRITGTTDALGHTTKYTYDSNNNVASIADSNGHTRRFTYDFVSNLLTSSDALANTTTFTYDAYHDPLTVKTPRGNTTTFTYDANGNLIGIRNPLGNTTVLGWDSYGSLVSATDANGHMTQFAYDGMNDLTTVTDPLSHVTNFIYDPVGRLTAITDANNFTSTRGYDLLDHVTDIGGPLGQHTLFAYDSVGNLSKITDPNRHTTSYAYDAVGNLVKVTDASGHSTTYSYDRVNNRTKFTNAVGHSTTYSYDADNRLTKITDPLLFATTYAYDGVGNVTSLRDAKGQTTRFAYDAANRLTNITYADSSTVGYRYDADSNRISMTDPHGTTSYTYDALDRISSTTQAGGTVAYRYDRVSNRSSITYPDLKVMTYSYDAANRLTQVKDWLGRTFAYSYDLANNLKKIAYPNSTAASFTYDAANRLTRIIHSKSGAAFRNLAYAFDAAGNRTSVNDNGSATTFAYNSLNELTSSTTGNAKTTWTYDNVGNRLQQVTPSGTTTYSYDADDRMLTAGNLSFSYDADGNLITKVTPSGNVSYTFDAANRLVGVNGPGVTSSFTYDGDGNRVTQDTAAGAYTYINDVVRGIPRILEEHGPDGNIDYGYATNLLESLGSSFNYFYHLDALGTVVGLSTSTGTSAATYHLDPWGNGSRTGTVGTKNKFGFAGLPQDPGTNLVYSTSRYYDPTIGRFLSTDPLKMLGGDINVYRYVWNQPTNFIDPLGFFGVPSSPLGNAGGVIGMAPAAVAGLAVGANVQSRTAALNALVNTDFTDGVPPEALQRVQQANQNVAIAAEAFQLGATTPSDFSNEGTLTTVFRYVVDQTISAAQGIVSTINELLGIPTSTNQTPSSPGSRPLI